MVNQNKLVNLGHCQGVVTGEVFNPYPNIAILNVRVRSDRKNPETKKHEMFLLNFIARDEMAKEVTEKCKTGDAVFITYELSEKVLMEESGNAEFRTEFCIKDIFIRDEEGKGRAGYLNTGHLQCRYLGICKVPNSKNVYRLDVLYTVSKTKTPQRFMFYVYGPKGEDIQNNYQKGQAILLQYKIEKSKRTRLNGKADYYTNLVVERLT